MIEANEVVDCRVQRPKHMLRDRRVDFLDMRRQVLHAHNLSIDAKHPEIKTSPELKLLLWTEELMDVRITRTVGIHDEVFQDRHRVLGLVTPRLGTVAV